ncbi:Phage tail tube protein [Natronincola peptidivorans]|uniref:Phage tail tube protein n=1 Tax=Natronincola peptidivorans TaxID=426128 RepID=A0A1I0FDA6_9FIRM|nr:phage tail tube protein [Natronincola peptidivorans]SET55492.1 Phage tail tube protein [Natronincola peptidivorans]
MYDVKNTINGTFGTLWVDNEIWAEVEAFEAIVNIDYEDVNMAGSLATHKKQIGWNGTGNLTIKKVNSRVARKMAEAVKRGQVPRMKFVGKLADPDALGFERVALYDVTFDSFTLLKFEQKTVMTQETAFAYSDYDLIDAI